MKNGPLIDDQRLTAILSTSQEIRWEELPRNDQFCVESDVKP